MPDCPPPAPAVKGQTVSFFPVVGGMRTDWSVWNVTVGPEGIENLYGTWSRFERGDEYKLRSVDAGLEELRQGGRAVPMPAPMPMAVDGSVPVEPARDPATVTAVGGGSSGVGGSAASGVATPTRTPPELTAEEANAVSVSSAPAPAVAPSPVDVAPQPAMASYPYPCPPDADCVAPQPQVVTITGVELTLQPNAVYSDGTAQPRMYLVPAYRFTGTFQGSESWEGSVIALHPDAIAPPPPVGVAPPGKGTEPAPMPVPDARPPETGSAG
jgi:hypothetical protein